MTASVHYLNEQNILIFLVQIFLLLGLSRWLGEVFRQKKQPPLTAELLVGIVLGPTILGRFFPQIHQLIFPPDPIQQAMLETVAWLGVLFLLLQIGLEIDFSNAWRQRGDALKIALFDFIVPLVICFFASLFLADEYLVDPNKRIIFALFMATAMAISAMPIAARALHDVGILKTDLGLLIMSALSVNDIIGWLIFTLVFGFFTQTDIDIARVIFILGATVGFTIIFLSIGRSVADYVISRFKHYKMPEPGSSLTFICLLGLSGGIITQLIGIHALFGFFIAGMMVGEAKKLSEKTRQVISQMVFAIFVPLFFANIGLKIDFFKSFDLFLALFVTVLGIVSRFLGAWIGVTLTKMPKDNRLAIAVSHTPGGAMEIVVAVLALENGLINETVFIAIVFGAVISSVIFGPWLSMSIKTRKAVSILEYFSVRFVIPQLKANNRDQAIAELTEVIATEEGLPDTEDILDLVYKREEVMGTALEEKVAIPHARVPSLHKPLVVFGRSLRGIDWNSPDGQLSNFIFLILTPEGKDSIQIQILSAVAKVMRDVHIKEAIMEAKEAKDIWNILRETFTAYHVRSR